MPGRAQRQRIRVITTTTNLSGVQWIQVVHVPGQGRRPRIRVITIGTTTTTGSGVQWIEVVVTHCDKSESIGN